MLNKLYARLRGFFWLPCPLCGQMYGGHEARQGGVYLGNGITKLVCREHDA